VRLSVQAALLSTVLGLMLPLPLAAAELSAAAGYASRLEMALNLGEEAALLSLLGANVQSRVQSRFARFSKEFPQARWRVETLEPLADGRSRIRVSVTGSSRADGQDYRLEAAQVLAVRLDAGVLQEEELLDEQSVLRSGSARLPVTLQVPAAVLTGSRYDIDVIVEEPLGPFVLAGGLVEVTSEQRLADLRPNLQLEPMGGGGLFKRVQAPQRPGVQNWAAMLVHPDGVITATKRVRVVGSKAEMARY